MELTENEIRKVMGVYIDVPVMGLSGDNVPRLGTIDEISYLLFKEGKAKLMLTPLSKLTDEDGLEIAKIICGQQYIDIEKIRVNFQPTLKDNLQVTTIKFDAYQVARFKGETPLQHIVSITNWGVINHYVGTQHAHELGNNCRSTFVFQFLVSKGYAMPMWFELGHWANGKTALELGLGLSE